MVRDQTRHGFQSILIVDFLFDGKGLTDYLKFNIGFIQWRLAIILQPLQ